MNLNSKSLGTVLFAVAIIVALAGLSKLSLHNERVMHQHDPLGARLLYIPDKQIVRLAALGDNATAADLLWLRSVFYVADNDIEELHHKWVETHSEADSASRTPDRLEFSDLNARTHPILRKMFFWNEGSRFAPSLLPILDIITDLDPRFVTPYYMGAQHLSIFYGRYSEARTLLDKGVEALPNRWEPAYYRGFLRLFYENDKSGAANDILAAALKPGAPRFVIELAASLKTGVSGYDAVVALLRSIYESTEDSKIRAQVEVVIEQLVSSRQTVPN